MSYPHARSRLTHLQAQVLLQAPKLVLAHTEEKTFLSQGVRLWNSALGTQAEAFIETRTPSRSCCIDYTRGVRGAASSRSCGLVYTRAHLPTRAQSDLRVVNAGM
ncbi:hypothetical protein CapIbe_020224 [Capra ibex]